MTSSNQPPSASAPATAQPLVERPVAEAPTQGAEPPLYVVAIGARPGALTRLKSCLPACRPMGAAFVVIQHLSPNKSMMAIASATPKCR